MGKIGRIARGAVRKEFLLSFVGTFVAVLGVPSAFVTMLGGHLSIGMTSCLTIVAISVSAITNRRKWGSRLRVNAIMPGKKTLRCPSDLNLTHESMKLARYEFGRNTIPFSKYEPLRAKNPYILVCLVESEGRFLGYFDVFPLKTNFAELFLQGRVTEQDLTHEDLLDKQEMARCKYIYIAGLAVCDSERQSGQVNAAILIWGLLKYIDHFYGSSNAYAIATAATGDGEALLESFKVPLICDSGIRDDGQKMYGLYLSRDLIAERTACVPDYSLLCSIEWKPAKNLLGVDAPVPRRPIRPQKRRRSLVS